MHNHSSVTSYKKQRADRRTSGLAYLHGMRGLAALIVVMSHCRNEAGRVTHLSSAHDGLAVIGWLGNFCVPTFMVLSGFLLCLPLIKTGTLPGGVGKYLERRANRILPAYLFALAASVFMAIRVTHLMSIYTLVTSDFWGPLFLVHDVCGSTANYNSPLWSMAVEWHCYFTLPFVVLVWKRFGPVRSLVAALSICLMGMSVSKVIAPGLCLWLYGLFYLGGLTAWLCHTDNQNVAVIRGLVPWGTVGLVSNILFWSLIVGAGDIAILNAPATVHLLWGVALLPVLLACHTQADLRLTKLLSSPPLQRLGDVSYSLYLLHYPLLLFVTHSLLSPHLPPVVFYLLTAAITLPMAGIAAKISYVIFERPYLTRRSAQTAASVPDTFVSRGQS